jgi:hypothetical protein
MMYPIPDGVARPPRFLASPGKGVIKTHAQKNCTRAAQISPFVGRQRSSNFWDMAVLLKSSFSV